MGQNGSYCMSTRNVLFLFVVFLLPGICGAQIVEPTHWKVEPSRTEVKVGDKIDLVFKGTIETHWHIYSVGFDPDCGPMPMEVTFEETQGVRIIDELRAIGDKKEYDETFECDVRIFENKAEFRQTIEIQSENPVIAGYFDGQVCEEGRCVPFTGDFRITNLKVTAAKPAEKEKPKEAPKTVAEKTAEPVKETHQAIADTPQKVSVDSSQEASVGAPTTKKDDPKNADYADHDNKGPILDSSILEGEPEYGKESFAGLLIFAFIAGLAALITPCVFPMVPMTVTFFLKDTQRKGEGIKKALVFGLSIVVLYTSAGTLFAVLLGVEGLNALATHWAVNLFIFVIFIVFALSFFGLFEITAPHQLVNKADQQAEKGGLIGVFFMAVTLVLISFSCTVPIVGSVLTLSAGGEIIKPISMMFCYSVAFALPFTFFAFFPELIKSLPKSGGWLNTVKVTLAFLELALCLKFFSIADQAYHWGLLDREINIALWIVIFSLLGFYLLGKIRTPNDSPIEKVTIPRLLLSIVVLTFVVYLIPGLWGAPLKALAGYLPPMHTHDFDLVALLQPEEETACEEPKYSEFLHLPHGLSGYYDYDQALACARAQNKPLFIDFTGHGCTNCREMEAVVWSDPQVMRRLKEDFVIVALYVDDKTELPESEWYVSEHDGRQKKTIGKQNADLQIRNLENNAQPFYVLVGKDERVLAWPYAYDRDPEKFVEFLERGKAKFKELYK